MKELTIIVKADVQGSVEASEAVAREDLTNEEVRVRVIHAGVRRHQRRRRYCLPPHRNAIIVGFNVRPDAAATDSAERARAWRCASTA